MTHTRDEVLEAVSAFFSGTELAAVLAELDRYGIERHEVERKRVQLAIIDLSRRSRDKLVEFVRVAKTDYRDILAWQQLGPLDQAQGQALQGEARALIEKWGKK